MIEKNSVIDTVRGSFPKNDLNLYLKLGHEACKKGKLDDSFRWYMKGLRKSLKLQNQEKISEFSELIITLL